MGKSVSGLKLGASSTCSGSKETVSSLLASASSLVAPGRSGDTDELDEEELEELIYEAEVSLPRPLPRPRPMPGDTLPSPLLTTPLAPLTGLGDELLALGPGLPGTELAGEAPLPLPAWSDILSSQLVNTCMIWKRNQSLIVITH